jgi:hypothetical protein
MQAPNVSFWQSSERNLPCFPALSGVLQNHAAPVIIGKAPFLDLFQRSKAAEAGEIVVQAAIACAWGFGGTVDGTHLTQRIERLQI